MRITLKIKDVEGMTEDKKHILLVEDEDLAKCILERKDFFIQRIIKEHLLKKDTRLMASLIEDKCVRNTIYMQEKARLEKKCRSI